MKAERSEFEGSTEGKKIDEELFEAIENFDGDGEALLVDLLGLFRKHAKKENAVISEMYANAHAKLRDLEKEFSDMKANLHRAYKGLENHKSLKIELQKQKELNKEAIALLDNIKDDMKEEDWNTWWIKQIESLIQKSKEL